MSSLTQMAADAARFEEVLRQAKARVHEPGLDWYPYGSLSNLATFCRVLGKENQFLFDRIAGQPLLDIGCADGELSFFFESLGFPIDAIDYPIPNFNAMRGVRALQRELGSSITLHSLDLDAPFELPSKQFGLVLLLGILYHLKNPFYLLERLSRSARYCLITTAVTEFVPALEPSVAGAPVAYLADEWELNGDSTNYWICSDAGLRRLLKRSNWDVRDYAVLPAGESRIAGQRAICLVESRLSEGVIEILYGRGWHALEPGGWRWTEREFSIRLESGTAALEKRLLLKLYVPEELLASGPLTLRAFANSVELPLARFSMPGEYEFSRDLPLATSIRLDFWLDRALPSDLLDPRERGIVVVSLEALRT